MKTSDYNCGFVILSVVRFFFFFKYQAVMRGAYVYPICDRLFALTMIQKKNLRLIKITVYKNIDNFWLCLILYRCSKIPCYSVIRTVISKGIVDSLNCWKQKIKMIKEFWVKVTKKPLNSYHRDRYICPTACIRKLDNSVDR